MSADSDNDGDDADNTAVFNGDVLFAIRSVFLLHLLLVLLL